MTRTQVLGVGVTLSLLNMDNRGTYYYAVHPFCFRYDGVSQTVPGKYRTLRKSGG